MLKRPVSGFTRTHSTGERHGRLVQPGLRSRSLVVTLVSTLVLAACGGGGSDEVRGGDNVLPGVGASRSPSTARGHGNAHVQPLLRHW